MAFADTHVWKGRAGILDLGLGSHMNEAAPYEVHSKVVFWDDTFQFFTHRFVCPDTGKLLVEGIRLKLLSSVLMALLVAVTRTIIKDHKRNTIQFEKVLEILDVERERPTEMPDVVQGFLKWDAATKVHMESVQVKPEMEKKEILNTA
ncbi:unnamed protein product [Aphanomyces euteiches]